MSTPQPAHPVPTDLASQYTLRDALHAHALEMARDLPIDFETNAQLRSAGQRRLGRFLLAFLEHHSRSGQDLRTDLQELHASLGTGLTYPWDVPGQTAEQEQGQRNFAVQQIRSGAAGQRPLRQDGQIRIKPMIAQILTIIPGP